MLLCMLFLVHGQEAIIINSQDSSLYNWEFKLHVYSKKKTSALSWEFLVNRKKADKKQLKAILKDKKLCETTNLCVEIMNSKWQVNGSLVMCYKFAFTLWHNVMLNLSNSKRKVGEM